MAEREEGELKIRSHERKTKLEDYVIWIYGPPKIGKTTFGLQLFSGGLLVAAEKGYNGLDVEHVIDITSWEDMIALHEHLMTDAKDTYPGIIYDTVDKLQKYCQSWVCDHFGYTYPSEGEMGKGWAQISDEFRRIMAPLTQLPCGSLFVSHDTSEKNFSVKGFKSDKRVPDIGGGSGRLIRELVDLEMYATVEASLPAKAREKLREQDKEGSSSDEQSVEPELRRILVLQPSPYVEAGGRMRDLPVLCDLSASALRDAFAKSLKQSAPAADNSKAKRRRK